MQQAKVIYFLSIAVRHNELGTFSKNRATPRPHNQNTTTIKSEVTSGQGFFYDCLCDQLLTLRNKFMFADNQNEIGKLYSKYVFSVNTNDILNGSNNINLKRSITLKRNNQIGKKIRNENASSLLSEEVKFISLMSNIINDNELFRSICITKLLSSIDVINAESHGKTVLYVLPFSIKDVSGDIGNFSADQSSFVDFKLMMSGSHNKNNIYYNYSSFSIVNDERLLQSMLDNSYINDSESLLSLFHSIDLSRVLNSFDKQSRHLLLNSNSLPNSSNHVNMLNLTYSSFQTIDSMMVEKSSVNNIPFAVRTNLLEENVFSINGQHSYFPFLGTVSLPANSSQSSENVGRHNNNTILPFSSSWIFDIGHSRFRVNESSSVLSPWQMSCIENIMGHSYLLSKDLHHISSIKNTLKNQSNEINSSSTGMKWRNTFNANILPSALYYVACKKMSAIDSVLLQPDVIHFPITTQLDRLSSLKTYFDGLVIETIHSEVTLNRPNLDLNNIVIGFMKNHIDILRRKSSQMDVVGKREFLKKKNNGNKKRTKRTSNKLTKQVDLEGDREDDLIMGDLLTSKKQKIITSTTSFSTLPSDISQFQVEQKNGSMIFAPEDEKYDKTKQLRENVRPSGFQQHSHLGEGKKMASPSLRAEGQGRIISPNSRKTNGMWARNGVQNYPDIYKEIPLPSSVEGIKQRLHDIFRALMTSNENADYIDKFFALWLDITLIVGRLPKDDDDLILQMIVKDIFSSMFSKSRSHFNHVGGIGFSYQNFDLEFRAPMVIQWYSNTLNSIRRSFALMSCLLNTDFASINANGSAVELPFLHVRLDERLTLLRKIQRREFSSSGTLPFETDEEIESILKIQIRSTTSNMDGFNSYTRLLYEFRENQLRKMIKIAFSIAKNHADQFGLNKDLIEFFSKIDVTRPYNSTYGKKNVSDLHNMGNDIEMSFRYSKTILFYNRLNTNDDNQSTDNLFGKLTNGLSRFVDKFRTVYKRVSAFVPRKTVDEQMGQFMLRTVVIDSSMGFKSHCIVACYGTCLSEKVSGMIGFVRPSLDINRFSLVLPIFKSSIENRNLHSDNMLTSIQGINIISDIIGVLLYLNSKGLCMNMINADMSCFGVDVNDYSKCSLLDFRFVSFNTNININFVHNSLQYIIRYLSSCCIALSDDGSIISSDQIIYNSNIKRQDSSFSSIIDIIKMVNNTSSTINATDRLNLATRLYGILPSATVQDMFTHILEYTDEVFDNVTAKENKTGILENISPLSLTTSIISIYLSHVQSMITYLMYSVIPGMALYIQR